MQQVQRAGRTRSFTRIFSFYPRVLKTVARILLEFPVTQETLWKVGVAGTGEAWSWGLAETGSALSGGGGGSTRPGLQSLGGAAGLSLLCRDFSFLVLCDPESQAREVWLSRENSEKLRADAVIRPGWGHGQARAGAGSGRTTGQALVGFCLAPSACLGKEGELAFSSQTDEPWDCTIPPPHSSQSGSCSWKKRRQKGALPTGANPWRLCSVLSCPGGRN